MQILFDRKKNDKMKTIKEMNWSQTFLPEKKRENEYEWKSKRNTFSLCFLPCAVWDENHSMEKLKQQSIHIFISMEAIDLDIYKRRSYTRRNFLEANHRVKTTTCLNTISSTYTHLISNSRQF